MTVNGSIVPKMIMTIIIIVMMTTICMQRTTKIPSTRQRNVHRMGCKRATGYPRGRVSAPKFARVASHHTCILAGAHRLVTAARARVRVGVWEPSRRGRWSRAGDDCHKTRARRRRTHTGLRVWVAEHEGGRWRVLSEQVCRHFDATIIKLIKPHRLHIVSQTSSRDDEAYTIRIGACVDFSCVFALGLN